jgi:hypothetical protein
MTGPYPPYEGGEQPQYPPYAGGDQPPYPPQGPPPHPGQAQPEYPTAPPPQYPPQQYPAQQYPAGPQPGQPPQWGQAPQPGQPPQWGQNQPWEQNPPTAPYPRVPPPAPEYGAAPGQVPPPWGGQAPDWATTPDPQPKRSLGAKVWPKIAGSLGVIVVVCVFGLVKAGVGGFLDASDEKDKAYPTASHPSGIAATSTATAKAGGPFAGTPAAKYPEGAAGITLPKAAASGVFTAKQVGDALASVKKVLVAGRLDSQMLVSRNPDPFLKLLAPAAKDDMRKDFSSDDFSVYATQFAPGAKRATVAPRVKGRISYRVTKIEGIPALEMTTNFVWVYPFQVSAGDGLVVVHDELVWQVLQPSKVQKSVRGLWLDHGQSYASNIDCDQYDKGLIAPGKPEFGAGPDNEDQDSMFDPDRTLDISDNC